MRKMPFGFSYPRIPKRPKLGIMFVNNAGIKREAQPFDQCKVTYQYFLALLPTNVNSFIQGNEFIVVNTIGSLSCYPHESCGHVERLEWLAWFVLGYLNSFL